MSEIQSAANLEWIKYGVISISVLAGVVNTLIIYIFQALKRDVEKIKIKQETDHDKIIKLEAEHKNNHLKSTII